MSGFVVCDSVWSVARVLPLDCVNVFAHIHIQSRNQVLERVRTVRSDYKSLHVDQLIVIPSYSRQISASRGAVILLKNKALEAKLSQFYVK